MPSRILVISDLHLQDSRPDITHTLYQFLQSNRGSCDSLFILGDLFEVWIGDDAQSDLATEVAAELKSFNAAGSSIYLMHGNRDFLIGDDYAALCGAHLIDEPFLLELSTATILLVHGDRLCTDDTDYMEFRKLVRQDSWKSEFLAKSITERREFARQARQQSQTAISNKAADIMDVNQAAVHELLSESGQTILIHGHTHRPAIHEISLTQPIDGNKQARRIVLGDWDKQAWVVEVCDGEIDLQHFPLQS